MPLIETHAGLLEALSDEMTPKFLATRSADGIPNVVPCTSLMPAGDVEDRLIFGNFLLRKSVGNLDADPRVGLLVMTTDLRGWVMQGRFLGWQRTGPYVDRIMGTDLLRYNAYTGIRNAGIVQVERVVRSFRLTKMRVLGEYLLAWAASLTGGRSTHGVALPLPARKGFEKMTAVRILAFLDEGGYPLTAPALSLQPSGERTLVCALDRSVDALRSLPAGTPVAASLLTLDIVSFQVKGEWLGSDTLLGVPVGRMSVGAVYAGGPPIPGRQVA